MANLILVTVNKSNDNESENNKENYLVFFFAVVAGYFLSNKAVQILY